MGGGFHGAGNGSSDGWGWSFESADALAVAGGVLRRDGGKGFLFCFGRGSLSLVRLEREGGGGGKKKKKKRKSSFPR